MRTIVIFTLFIVLGFLPVSAQEAGKLRAGVDVGCLHPHEGAFGFLKAIELKYNLRNNMNFGIKVETTSFIKHKNYEAELLSFSITYDYYFPSTYRRSSPFIGVGLGYFLCKSYGGDDFIELPWKFNNPAYFIRAGYEICKFRTFLTYNLIRKPSDKYRDNRNIDYISLSIGFYIGGGKWK